MELEEFKELFDGIQAENKTLKEKNQQLSANLAELTLVALRLKRQLEEERKNYRRR